MRRISFYAVAALVILGLLIQLIPYGRDHTNPPVKAEPAWDRPLTRSLAQAACLDCHSNRSLWTQYVMYSPLLSVQISRGPLTTW